MLGATLNLTFTDFSFLPFNHQYVATCNSDLNIDFWKIPEDLLDFKEEKLPV